MQLKQFIPQEFCLRCDVCCRFAQSDTIWAPRFTNSEIKYLVSKDILPPLVFTAQPVAKTNKSSSFTTLRAQRINLIEHKSHFICPCFNPSESKCRIYLNRPFECQLYPFLLTKADNKFYLAQDKKCPYLNTIEENKLKNYLDYLKKEFEEKASSLFLRKNKALFVEYPALDLKFLFPVDIDNAV